MTAALWAAGPLGETEAPLLCLSIQYPARCLETLAVLGHLMRVRSGKRAQASGMRQIWTCPTRGNLTTPTTRQSGYDRPCQTAAGKSPTLMALLRPQALKRILALNLSSMLMLLFLITHVYQCLQMFHPLSTPLTTLSPSFPVFLSPRLLLSPVSTSLSPSLLSCVCKTHAGEQC